MDKVYDSKLVELNIYEYWMNSGYFTPEIDKTRKPFVIIMPPPNVTGELHIGHALTVALEDLMVRWHRMKGDPTLFLPGSDHAGIATQVVVEKSLASQGITRHDLGRELFINKVWEWVELYGDRIYDQFKRLGASCDWSRKSFTLDSVPSKAVRNTFVNLYNKGLIYRKDSITNWCPRCLTALSDLEVKYKDEKGNLYYIKYDIENSDSHIVIATTRPETMLGDTAVAVNSKDERYKKYIGKSVILPIVGRRLNIIKDSIVDIEYGTGALKVTPGHDPNDFILGEKHKLEFINLFDANGKLNDNAGDFAGLSIKDSRNEIVKELEKLGNLLKIEDINHSVGHCDRCDEVVEPIISKQWYVKVEPLAKKAREVITNGSIKIIPDRFSKIYFNWMDNIRDWCISRQLWWGHRIPVWNCNDCNSTIVQIEDIENCNKCYSNNLYQDPDVLDTWFSSGLWTHSTLGWPENTEDLDYFYPSSVMETGHDILFFWVARMIMLGIENTGEIPFQDIYLHGLVRDPDGIKMSKSKGNVMDPLDLIDTYGADALRFALTTGTSPGNDMRLNEQKMESARNFANKLWNASRFVISNVNKYDLNYDFHSINPSNTHDRWIITRYLETIKEVDRFFSSYQFSEAQKSIYDFFWTEFCDWYLEMIKIRLRNPGEKDAVLSLVYILHGVLRLLHPFMPFITEKIWQLLMKSIDSQKHQALITSSYPIFSETDNKLIDNDSVKNIMIVIEIIRAIRNIKVDFRIQNINNLDVYFKSDKFNENIIKEKETIIHMSKIRSFMNYEEFASVSKEKTVSVVLSNCVLNIVLPNEVDINIEIKRLEFEKQELISREDGLSKRLNDNRFLSNAPQDIIDKEMERLNSIIERKNRIEDLLSKTINS
ncbi:MAG: valine--tRNA ligase [Chloroflexi bacterium]|nr:valine--tRNA ligase [Chloroflexota bacterium]